MTALSDAIGGYAASIRSSRRELAWCGAAIRRTPYPYAPQLIEDIEALRAIEARLFQHADDVREFECAQPEPTPVALLEESA